MLSPNPFEPKPNSRLRVGDFWDIPLSNGEHAVGVVVLTTPEQDPSSPTSLRMFVAGLLDWSGPATFVPDPERPQKLLDWGTAHIDSIRGTGGAVLGNVEYDLNGIRRRSHEFGKPMWVYVNGVFVGETTDEEASTLPVTGAWGLDFARLLAERALVEKLPIVQ